MMNRVLYPRGASHEIIQFFGRGHDESCALSGISDRDERDPVVGALDLWRFATPPPRPGAASAQRPRGSGTVSRARRFREALREALVAIAAVEKARGRKFDWRLDEDDLVHVVRESGN